MADAAACLVTIAQLEQARSLLRQKKYCDCAALLVKARVDDAPATAASAWGTQTSSLRDGGRTLDAAMRALRADARACLGLGARATAADVRRAHRQLALQHHPDKTGGKTNDLFAAIQAAHDDLSEALARREALAAERDRPAPRGGAGGERRLSTTPPPADAPAPAPPPPAPPPPPPAEDADAIWERRFWDLAEYKMRRGHCYVPAAWASPRDPPSLGDWAVEQRLLRETGRLLERRAARLETVGFNVDDRDWRKRILPPDDEAKVPEDAPKKPRKAKSAKKKEEKPRRSKGEKSPKRRASKKDRKKAGDAPPAAPPAAPPPPPAAAARSVSSPSLFCAPEELPPPGDDGACSSCARGAAPKASWWSSERSRDAPRREQPRTEASTFEVSLFGYVLMKLDRVASYGDEPAGS